MGIVPVGDSPSADITDGSRQVEPAPVSISSLAGTLAGTACPALVRAPRLGALTPTDTSTNGPLGDS